MIEGILHFTLFDPSESLKMKGKKCVFSCECSEGIFRVLVDVTKGSRL